MLEATENQGIATQVKSYSTSVVCDGKCLDFCHERNKPSITVIEHERCCKISESHISSRKHGSDNKPISPSHEMIFKLVHVYVLAF